MLPFCTDHKTFVSRFPLRLKLDDLKSFINLGLPIKIITLSMI